jgi:MFS family permease
MICFLYIEAKVASEPLAPMHIITNKELLLVNICNFFSAGTWMSTSFNISLYYQAIRKQSAGEAGLGLLPGIIATVLGSLFAGIVMQKTGKYYKLTVISHSCMAMGNLLLCATTGLAGHSLIGNYIGEMTSNQDHRHNSRTL